MNNFEYNLSPTTLRTPTRYPSSTNPRDRSRKYQNTMPPNTGNVRAKAPTLSNLPRFHPANYATYAQVNSVSSSSNSSNVTCPESLSSISQGPLSPRSCTHPSPQLSEAQRQLYLYHRELYSINRSGSNPSTPYGVGSRPASPNLQPLASPGAVTPFELEEADQDEGYLMRSAGASTSAARTDVLEHYIRRETASDAFVQRPR